MTAAIDRRRTSFAWWIVPEVLALVILLGLVVFQTASAASPTEIKAQLAVRAERVLETLPPAEHHNHGHEVAGADKVVCGAEIFGFEPADAATVEEVQRAFVHFLCASGQPGTNFQLASKFAGPAVLEMKSPPALKIPPPGLGYRDAVLAMMPKQYQELAFVPFIDAAIPDSVVKRFDAAVAGPTPSAGS